jgi:hypothetical protein
MRSLLGYTYDKTLRDIFISKNPNLITLKEIKETPDNEQVYFVAEADANSQKRMSKNGNEYLSFDCSDHTATVNVKIFTKSLESAILMNDGKTPKKGQIIMVKGTKKEGNCVFANEFGIQNNKIYGKFADVKNEERKNKEEKLDK